MSGKRTLARLDRAYKEGGGFDSTVADERWTNLERKKTCAGNLFQYFFSFFLLLLSQKKLRQYKFINNVSQSF